MQRENPYSRLRGNKDDANLLLGKSFGQFRIVEYLGSGFMASVFKAYQPNLDRYVAIKVLPAYYARDPIFLKRFQQEARSVAKLLHANIVPIHEFGEQDEITYIVMEYVDGGTLNDFLKQRRISVVEAVDFIIQAAEGLGYAHGHGIVHRDVKPTNMLLRKDGHLLISDFGIAKILEGAPNLVRVGTSIGTPEYMSPEQGTGLPVDRRSDIYSLGIVFFHALTGRVPFSADSRVSIIVKHLNEPLPVEKLREANVPLPIEQVALKMTAKAPADRYQTTDALIETLMAAVIASHLSLPRWRSNTPAYSSTPAIAPYTPATPPLASSAPLAATPPLAAQQPGTYAGAMMTTVSCFRCGTINQRDRLFCMSCGYELADMKADSDRAFAPDGQPILARITFQSGSLAGRAYLLHQEVTTIGRTNSNDVIIPGLTVSRRHARLWFETNRWYLTDMQSANGTFVNRTRIQLDQAIPLNDGDSINFGDEVVLFNTVHSEGVSPSKGITGAQSAQTEKQPVAGKQEIHLSLFAVVHAELEEGDIAFTEKGYALQAGISQIIPANRADPILADMPQLKPEDFAEKPIDLVVPRIDTLISFDILLHASKNVELTSDWHQRLRYDPGNTKPQLVEFIFQVTAPGPSFLVIDFYHERRWLRSTRLDFNASEESELATVQS